MATARFVINAALRKLGVLASGREARTSDFTDTLEALRGLYGSWIASGAFGRLHDVTPSGTDYQATGHERILRRTPTLSVTLPELVSDGSFEDYGRERTGYYGTLVTVTDTVDGVSVTIEPGQPLSYATTPRDGAPVVISDTSGGQTAAWLYDGTVKHWERVDVLDADGDAPRSWADPQGLASCLAMEIADQFGAEVPAASAMQARRFLTSMTQRFGMRREEGVGVYC